MLRYCHKKKESNKSFMKVTGDVPSQPIRLIIKKLLSNFLNTSKFTGCLPNQLWTNKN